MGPLEELRTAVEDAAAELRNGKPAPSVRPTLERPKKAGLRRLLDERRDAAGAGARRAAARDRRAAGRRAVRAAGRARSSASRSPGPGFLNVFLADAWYATALEDLLAAGDGFGAGAPEPARAGARRVRLREPDRPADRRLRPPRRLRRRARADPRARGPRRRPRVLLQRHAARRSTASGESIRARARGEDLPEDGYEGDYVGELARGDPGRGRRATPAVLARAGVERDHGRHPGHARGLPRALRRAGSSSAACTRASPSAVERALELLEERATSTAPRARCGCARRRSATTRTACSSARPASRPTSPPTSPTTRTSSSAATTA